LVREPKPAALAVRGGCWFRSPPASTCTSARSRPGAAHGDAGRDPRPAVAEGVDLKTRSRLGHSDPRLTLAVYAQKRPQPTAMQRTFWGRDSWENPRFAPGFARHLWSRHVVAPRTMNARWTDPGREGGATEVVPDLRSYQSGRRDLNPRPQRPEVGSEVSREVRDCRCRRSEAVWRDLWTSLDGAGSAMDVPSTGPMVLGCRAAVPIIDVVPAHGNDPYERVFPRFAACA